MFLLTNAQCVVGAAPGSGTVALGAAAPGAQTWAAAGAVDGGAYGYRIEEGAAWEVGIGTYTAQGATLARTKILASSGGGAAVAFGAAAIVSQVATPADLVLPFRNRLLNGNFAINARGASSSSTGYAAGAYIMDRWKAGGNGCTLSFATAANGDVTVTITAGSLLQVIEGPVYFPEGGALATGWTGTAVGRVYQSSQGAGAYAPAPLITAGLTAGANIAVEFGLPSGATSATLSLAQAEPGNVATPFERRGLTVEQMLCRRYARKIGRAAKFVALTSSTIEFTFEWADPMRAAPGISALVASLTASRIGVGNATINLGSAIDTASGVGGCRYFCNLSSGTLTQGEYLTSLSDDVFIVTSEL